MSAADVPEETSSRALDEARRHRAGVRRASAELERALAAPAGAGASWRANVSRKVTDLQEAFSQHVAATEHPDGLLAESVSANPRLAHRCDMLRRDHHEISALLTAVASDLAAAEGVAGAQGRAGAPKAAGAEGAGAAEADDSGQIRSGALEVLARISQHRHLGADLVYQAYMVDIEAAD